MADKNIFISYRRQDSAGESGRLADALKQHYDAHQIFMDIDTIEPGLDFVEVINKGVSSCEVLLAIIGPAWIDIKGVEGKRRLDDEGDYIRLEIATALKRNIRVIPVLVDGARMPKTAQLPEDLKPLARRNAHEISNTRWNYDVEELVKILEKDIGPSRKKKFQPQPQSTKKNNKVPLMIIGGVVLLIAGILMFSENEGDYEPDDFTAYENNTNLPLQKGGGYDAVDEEASTGEDIPEEELASQESNYEATPTYGAVAGTWYESSGSYFVMSQQNNQLSLQEYNMYDIQVGTATGNINGNQVLLNYSNTLMGLNGTIQLTLSADGSELSGKITESSTGTVLPLYYTNY